MKFTVEFEENEREKAKNYMDKIAAIEINQKRDEKLFKKKQIDERHKKIKQQIKTLQDEIKDKVLEDDDEIDEDNEDDTSID